MQKKGIWKGWKVFSTRWVYPKIIKMFCTACFKVLFKALAVGRNKYHRQLINADDIQMFCAE